MNKNECAEFMVRTRTRYSGASSTRWPELAVVARAGLAADCERGEDALRGEGDARHDESVGRLASEARGDGGRHGGVVPKPRHLMTRARALWSIELSAER